LASFSAPIVLALLHKGFRIEYRESEKKDYMIRLDQPDLKKIEHKAQQMIGAVSFAQGALRIGGVSEVIKDYVSQVIKTDKADYYSHSLGMRSLRQKIAAYVTSLHGGSLSEEHVMVSHGALNGIAALCLMLLDRDDEVLIPEPTYPPYVNAVVLAKAYPKLVPAYRYHAGQWMFDLETLKAAVTQKTKMIIIAHPSNPCGVCLTEAEIQELAAWSEERKIYCIVDEAYDNYFFDAKAVSSSSYVEQYNYLVRVGSFSKTFGMSGWRVGYVVAPKQLIAQCAGVQDGLIVCPSVVGQYAALCALDHTDIAASYTCIVEENRTLAYSLLAPLIEQGIFECHMPQAGFFFFLKTQCADTAPMAEKILDHVQVALVPGRDFGPSGKSFLRLCYARDQQTLVEGIARLCDIKSKIELFS
jgi:aspartate/methionine/tyrosine aminotransferase